PLDHYPPSSYPERPELPASPPRRSSDLLHSEHRGCRPAARAVGRAFGRRPHAAGRASPDPSQSAIVSAWSDGTDTTLPETTSPLPQIRYTLPPQPIALCLQEVLVPGRRRALASRFAPRRKRARPADGGVAHRSP